MSVYDITKEANTCGIDTIIVSHSAIDYTPSKLEFDDGEVFMWDGDGDHATRLNFTTAQQVEDFIKGIRKAQELGWLPK